MGNLGSCPPVFGPHNPWPRRAFEQPLSVCLFQRRHGRCYKRIVHFYRASCVGLPLTQHMASKQGQSAYRVAAVSQHAWDQQLTCGARVCVCHTTRTSNCCQKWFKLHEHRVYSRICCLTTTEQNNTFYRAEGERILAQQSNLLLSAPETHQGLCSSLRVLPPRPTPDNKKPRVITSGYCHANGLNLPLHAPPGLGVVA